MSESTFPVSLLRLFLLTTERSQTQQMMLRTNRMLLLTARRLSEHVTILCWCFSSHFLSVCIKKKNFKKAPQPAWRCAEENTQWDLLWSLPAVDHWHHKVQGVSIICPQSDTTQRPQTRKPLLWWTGWRSDSSAFNKAPVFIM